MVTVALLEGIRALKDALPEEDALDSGDVLLAEVVHGGIKHRRYVCHKCRRAGYVNSMGLSVCGWCPGDSLSNREFLQLLQPRPVRVYPMERHSTITKE